MSRLQRLPLFKTQTYKQKKTFRRGEPEGMVHSGKPGVSF